MALQVIDAPRADWPLAERSIQDHYHRRARRSPRYSWETPSHVFEQQERERSLLAALRRAGMLPLAGRRILEIGCGTGACLRMLVHWGADPGRLAGVDLLAAPLEEARRRVPAQLGLQRAGAANLPFSPGSFDIVLQVTAFSSMLDAGLRQRVAGEMLRVLAPGGLVLWYDFHVNNPANRDVVGITRREIGRLFPHCTVAMRRAGLAPPLMRPLARLSWLAACLAAQLPPLCTHYAGTIRPA